MGPRGTSHRLNGLSGVARCAGAVFLSSLETRPGRGWPGLFQEGDNTPPCHPANVLSIDKAEVIGRIDLKQIVGYRTNSIADVELGPKSPKIAPYGLRWRTVTVSPISKDIRSAPTCSGPS